ncbi:unnamed protein product [Amoebophrya sp. A25]|nr:unnamed protein product [Amoebophrya sp. A25]|eukprot:GSA25T00005594001.1
MSFGSNSDFLWAVSYACVGYVVYVFLGSLMFGPRKTTEKAADAVLNDDQGTGSLLAIASRILPDSIFRRIAPHAVSTFASQVSADATFLEEDGTSNGADSDEAAPSTTSSSRNRQATTLQKSSPTPKSRGGQNSDCKRTSSVRKRKGTKKRTEHPSPVRAGELDEPEEVEDQEGGLTGASDTKIGTTTRTCSSKGGANSMVAAISQALFGLSFGKKTAEKNVADKAEAIVDDAKSGGVGVDAPAGVEHLRARKSLRAAYRYYIVGGCLSGSHLVYLERNVHALLYGCTGGFLGVGVLFDLLFLWYYVLRYNKKHLHPRSRQSPSVVRNAICGIVLTVVTYVVLFGGIFLFLFWAPFAYEWMTGTHLEGGSAVEDPYRTLGLSRGAGTSEVKQAFRSLSMKYHPDKNPDCSECAEKMASVNRAHALVKQQLRRNSLLAAFAKKASKSTASSSYEDEEGELSTTADEPEAEDADASSGEMNKDTRSTSASNRDHQEGEDGAIDPTSSVNETSTKAGNRKRKKKKRAPTGWDRTSDDPPSFWQMLVDGYNYDGPLLIRSNDNPFVKYGMKRPFLESYPYWQAYEDKWSSLYHVNKEYVDAFMGWLDELSGGKVTEATREAMRSAQAGSR